MRRTTASTLLAVAVFALAACGGSETTTTAAAEEATTTTQPSTTSTGPITTAAAPEVGLEVVPRSYDDFRAQPTACEAQAPDPVTPMQFDAPDDLNLSPEATMAVTMSTSCGDLSIKLDPSLATETVNSFVFLASEGYFDGTVFHRVIPGFVAQGGDQTATGTGGPGYVIPDEFPPPTVAYERGVLAMANAGPGTTGSQFFIMLDDGNLPPHYSILGWVTEGLEILDLLQRVPLGQSPTSPDPTPSTPLETIYVDAVTVAS
jgi:cyclophilin family peptidyl-prolyl cis-trans isomerase